MSLTHGQEESEATDSVAVAERIMSLQDPGESQVDFAWRIGISKQLVNNYAKGRHGASLEAVLAVIRNTDVDPTWLLTGQPADHGSPGNDSSDESIRLALMRHALEGSLYEVNHALKVMERAPEPYGASKKPKKGDKVKRKDSHGDTGSQSD